jgi:endonuclease YncB( thermonuclease family)
VAIALTAAFLVPASFGRDEAFAFENVKGPAMAVDGDTLDIAGTRVRLEGIDAPEYAQTCARAAAGSWSCGKEAQRTLAKMVAGQTVDCESRGRDKYDRVLGVCSVAGREINAEMVRSGLAWAFIKYSNSYASLEAEARAAKVGIWQGETEPAWVYREKRWTGAEQTAPEGCAIKGNVTDKGHIYHLPWSPWYAKVKIEAEKGERWFCSETEAAAAGWRPAMIN